MKKTINMSFCDLKFRDDFNSDCGGFGYEWTCPDCKETIHWSPAMWWEMKCDCREWDFNIKVKGELTS